MPCKDADIKDADIIIVFAYLHKSFNMFIIFPGSLTASESRMPTLAPVFQRIESRTPTPEIGVRFPTGVPSDIGLPLSRGSPFLSPHKKIFFHAAAPFAYIICAYRAYKKYREKYSHTNLGISFDFFSASRPSLPGATASGRIKFIYLTLAIILLCNYSTGVTFTALSFSGFLGSGSVSKVTF